MAELGILIYFVVMIFIIVRALNKKPANQKDSVNRNQVIQRSAAIEQYYKQHPDKDPRKQNVIQKVQNFQEHVDNISVVPNNALKLSEFEDRNNDWLANQIRFERRYNPIADEMIDLKLSHIRDCDAEHVKIRH